MSADAYRTAEPCEPPPVRPLPVLPPHVERRPDGSRVLRKCRPPGYWDRAGFVDGDVWECGICGAEFRFVDGWIFHFWMDGWKPPSPASEDPNPKKPGKKKAAAQRQSKADP